MTSLITIFYIIGTLDALFSIIYFVPDNFTLFICLVVAIFGFYGSTKSINEEAFSEVLS